MKNLAWVNPGQSWSLLVAACALAGGVPPAGAALDWHVEPASGVPTHVVWMAESGRSYSVSAGTNLGALTLLPGYPRLGTGSWVQEPFPEGNAAYVKIESASSAGPDMVPIAAGHLYMGDSLKDGASDELPVFDLYLPPYAIGRFEVTKSLWDEVRQWGLAHGYPDLPPGTAKGPDHPVGSVTWHAAAKWCNALSEREGLTPCYTTNGAVYRYGTFTKAVSNVSWNGYRLPAEAEWEYAARGGVRGTRFPWSDTGTISHARANYNSSGGEAYDTSPTHGYHPSYATGAYPYTSPVGSFPPNDFGLHDMAGNAWEWCTDWYDSYPSNLGGPPSGTYRVTRGGGWGSPAAQLRNSLRQPLSAVTSNVGVGFRLARRLE